MPILMNFGRVSAGRKTSPGMPQLWTTGTNSLPPMTACLQVCHAGCCFQHLFGKGAANNMIAVCLRSLLPCAKG